MGIEDQFKVEYGSPEYWRLIEGLSGSTAANRPGPTRSGAELAKRTRNLFYISQRALTRPSVYLALLRRRTETDDPGTCSG